MKKLLAILVAMVAFTFAAKAASYEINDASIDALVAEAEMVAPASADAAATAGLSSASADSKTIVAFVLDTVGLGAFGIHRLILGTRAINVLLYIITFGGIFGIIPLVDWIMLLLDIVEGTASYIGNPSFIMWL
ncbi:MAG: TM2 domain-containing protein [Bacteroidales bacterium]|nr:TM2 domain-containing protein [Bacteroidales bacterium]